MDILFEQKIVQNSALSMELIHVVVLDYYKKNKAVTGLKFPLAFLILPMLFQKRTTDALYNKTSPGSIYKAISENREIPLDLQKRMEACFNKTIQAISLGLSAELFLIDYSQGELIPVKKSILDSSHTEDVKRLINVAKRLGHTFAELTIEEISQTLKVVF